MTMTNEQARLTVSEFLFDYEFRFECRGGYAPTDAEKAMLEDAIEGYLAARSAPHAEVLGVIGEIAAERQRQISKEGYDTGHDDAHDKREIDRRELRWSLSPSPPVEHQGQGSGLALES